MTSAEKINTLIAKIDALKHLRQYVGDQGKDQKIRCDVVAILFGKKKINGKTPTERFLEYAIALTEQRHRQLVTDLLDDE